MEQRFFTRWKAVWGGCCLLVLLVTGCHDDPRMESEAGLSGKLTVTGSSTIAPLATEIAKRFEQRNPRVRVDVQSGGSGRGISDARNGTADIGMASRELKEEERDLNGYQIAVDGVSLIVHKSNRVADLSNQQIVDIFTNKINNWSEVGGPDQEITVVHKAAGRATLEVFLKHFNLKNPQVKPDVIVGDNEHGVKTVAGLQGAIGYVSIGTAEADARSGVPIRLLPVSGIAATSENVACGKFPMSRPLNLVTNHSPGKLALAFIKFCQSEEVHDLVVSQHFVPVQD